MIAWLRSRRGIDPAIEIDAEEMLKAYGAQAHEISANLAHDMRSKGDSKRAQHWARVTTCVAGMSKSA
jgi:hypothetical protein